MMESVFQFTDYRQFLKNYYENHKAEDKGYTYRKMAGQTGFASSNYLMLVMTGRRNLGQKSIDKICGGLGLKKKESEYFSYLVFFAQAKTSVEKNYYFGLISSFRTRSTVTKVSADQFNYFNDWYNPIVRELIKGEPADLDPKKIAARVSPPILPKQVKKSIRLLKELELIYEDENGKLQQSSGILNTDNEIHSLGIRNFHKKMCDLAKESIENVPPPSREISSITGSVSKQGFDKVKKRLHTFREELLQIINDDKNDDRVYQINLQLFPLTQSQEKGKK